MTTITATPNYSKKTFTIRMKEGKKTINKFRTLEFNQDEFEEMQYYTDFDWYYFLRDSNEYYIL